LQDEDPNWQFILWTNNEQFIPHSKQKLETHGIHVFNIDRLESPIPLDDFIKNKNFGLVSDILRVIIVESQGGVYRDLDYRFLNAKIIHTITHTYDYFAGMYGKILLSNAFFGAVSHHPVLQAVKSNIIRNLTENSSPAYVKAPCSTFDEVIMKTGPLCWTISNKQKLHADPLLKDIVFSDGVLYDVCIAKGPDWVNQTGLRCNYNYFTDQYLTGLIGNDQFGSTWSNKTLPHLDFVPDHLATGEVLMDKIKSNQIKSIHRVYNKISNSSLKPILEALINNDSVENIYFNINEIDDDGVYQLAEIIKKHPRLKILSLIGNLITDQGADYLAQAIKKNSSLEKIALLGNFMTEKGYTALKKAIHSSNKNIIIEELKHENQTTSFENHALYDSLDMI